MFRLHFKEAETPAEFEQIHALNHRVFAEEVAQHPRHPSGTLIDRWHNRNRYFVALRGDLMVGMISVQSGPEFSIAKRLNDVTILEQFDRPLEVRLLAIAPPYRYGIVLAGLFWQAYSFAIASHFSHLLISGISTKLAMYQKLGFVQLGSPVPEGAAEFVPMVMALRKDALPQPSRAAAYERRWQRRERSSDPVSLMPGPVCIHPRVRAAFNSPPESHRSDIFLDRYRRATSLLSGLLSGAEAVLFPGTGTLANDAVAANLRAIFKRSRGLVIVNGEFGERLTNHASRADLQFNTVRFTWGQAWDPSAIENALNAKPAWVWAVQLETSTGVLNATDALIELATKEGAAVALDCVSSVGAAEIAKGKDIPLLVSGVSGKSLGAYAGLAFVYLSQSCKRLLADKALCPSFDLVGMLQTNGPPCTMCSSLLFALARALEDQYGSPRSITQRHEEYQLLGSQARRHLRRLGIEPLAPELVAAPNVTTFALPDLSFPETCLKSGYRIAYESAYLRSRGWGQIATMGSVTLAHLDAFFHSLRVSPRAAKGVSNGPPEASHLERSAAIAQTRWTGTLTPRSIAETGISPPRPPL